MVHHRQERCSHVAGCRAGLHRCTAGSWAMPSPATCMHYLPWLIQPTKAGFSINRLKLASTIPSRTTSCHQPHPPWPWAPALARPPSHHPLHQSRMLPLPPACCWPSPAVGDGHHTERQHGQMMAGRARRVNGIMPQHQARDWLCLWTAACMPPLTFPPPTLKPCTPPTISISPST